MKNIAEIRQEINFRDLGGYRAKDGRTIRSGMLYRSGGLFKLNEKELECVRSLGIRTIVDLRTKGEAEQQPDPDIPDAELLRYSGVVNLDGEEIDFSPQGMHRLGEGAVDQYEKLRFYYRNIPFDNEAFRMMMHAIEEGHVPLVFHCASGKDRAGVAAMVVLTALGIPEETVFADYVKSNDYMNEELEKAFAFHADTIETDPMHKTLLTMESGVYPPIGEAVLHEMRTRYGTFETYLEKEYGLTMERLERLRDHYLI